MDTKTAALHIDMPQPAPQPKPAPRPAPQPTPEQAPTEVELVLPKAPKEPEPSHDVIEVRYPKPEATSEPEVIEVHYPGECEPCPVYDVEVVEEAPVVEDPVDIGDVDVVIYDSIYPMDDLTNRTGTFVLEDKIEQPAPAEEEPAEPVIDVDPCEEDLERKKQITQAIGCC